VPFLLLLGVALVVGGGCLLTNWKWDWIMLAPVGMILFGLVPLGLGFKLMQRAVSDFRSGRLTVTVSAEGISAPRDRWARVAEFVPFTAVQACWYESLFAESPEDTEAYRIFVIHTAAGQWHIDKLKMPTEDAFFAMARLVRSRLPQLGDDPDQRIMVLQWGATYDVTPNEPSRQILTPRGRL
jgi:hypothetical protein